MSTFSISNSSPLLMGMSYADGMPSPRTEALPKSEPATRPETIKLADRPKSASAFALEQEGVAVVSRTVDMRFEFNAATRAWMLNMTDAGSGDVVRRIALKGFSENHSADLHQSGHWIDKAV